MGESDRGVPGCNSLSQMLLTTVVEVVVPFRVKLPLPLGEDGLGGGRRTLSLPLLSLRIDGGEKVRSEDEASDR